MKRRAVLFHGFNVWDSGKDTTDRLRPYLEAEGLEVHENDYGFVFLIGVLRNNQKFAERAAAKWGRDAVGVGHSNGCTILWRASLLGAFNKLIFLNPALDSNVRFPENITEVHVYHTRYDRAVKWASRIPWVIWGAMGRDGYRSRTGVRHAFIHNHDMARTTLPFQHRVNGHSQVFQPMRLNYWGPHIAQHAAAAD